MANRFVIYIAGLLFLNACSVSNKPGKDTHNLSHIYNPSTSKIHPEYKVYHNKEESSLLMIHVYTDELLYNYVNETEEHQAHLKIHYKLFLINEDELSPTIADSATYHHKIDMGSNQKDFMSSIVIKASANKNYLLKIYTSDENRKRMHQHFILVDKTTRFTKQNFNIISARTGIPLFRDVISSSEKVQIQTKRAIADTMYLLYFRNKYKIPSPPFSVITQEPVLNYPDTTFIYKYSDTIKFKCEKEGIYLFKTSRETLEGVTLFRFSEFFPSIKSTSEMLYPLEYLASSAEFNQLVNENNRKLMIDNYWLGAADNIDNAKELIRVYYTRVNYANLYFTSDREGWKTDRGMIYIIYGAPHNLHKSLNSEKWIYYTGSKNTQIEFEFYLRKNHFDDSDFVLRRKDELSTYWSKAVYSWKNGRIFSFDNY